MASFIVDPESSPVHVEGSLHVVRRIRPYTANQNDMVNNAAHLQVVAPTYAAQYGALTHANILSFGLDHTANGVLYRTPHLPRRGIISYLMCGDIPAAELQAFLANCVAQFASGLQHIHENRLIHGNVRASNLLVDPDGNVKISDAGFQLTFCNPNGRISRLWRWRPPTIIRQEILDDTIVVPTQNIDIYAWGMTVIEIHTREVPYRSLSDTRYVSVLVERGFPPIGCPPTMAAGIWNVVRDCIDEARLPNITMGTVSARLGL